MTLSSTKPWHEVCAFACGVILVTIIVTRINRLREFSEELRTGSHFRDNKFRDIGSRDISFRDIGFRDISFRDIDFRDTGFGTSVIHQSG